MRSLQATAPPRRPGPNERPTCMHREISHADEAFGRHSNETLYLLTGLIGLILGVHFWPDLVRATAGSAWGLPTWSQEVIGYKIAVIAALVGLVRILVNSLDPLLQGR